MIKRVLFGPAGRPTPGALGITLCEVLTEVTPDTAHAVLTVEWFAAGTRLPDPPDGVPCFVGDEVVMRGAEWLAAHRRRAGPAYKHMALAARAPGLSPEEFSARWRARAGSVGAGPAAVVIPDAVRGLAYAQNHPVGAQACPYDAVNEVWFDDPGDLVARARWFDHNLAGGAEDDLVTQPRFVAMRETFVRLD